MEVETRELVTFYDSTLRDGEQMPGVAYDRETRIRLAAALDSLGVNELDIGFAASGARHREAMAAVVASGLRAKTLSMARPTSGDIDAAKQTGVDGVILIALPNLNTKLIEQTRDVMDRQLTQLVRLVDDLLDVSRVMQAKIELRKEKVQLAAIIRLATETAQPIIDSQGHSLHMDLSEHLPMVEVDPIRIGQVLSNLLTNAAKYTNPGGDIWLSVSREDQFAVLRRRMLELAGQTRALEMKARCIST